MTDYEMMLNLIFIMWASSFLFFTFVASDIKKRLMRLEREQ